MLKRFFVIAIALLCYATLSKSQSLVGPGGKYVENSVFALSWSVGEPVTTTLSGAGCIITQGFHQPEQNDVQNIILPQGWSIFSTYSSINAFCYACAWYIKPSAYCKGW
jgi:hypothetical protein